ncbi:hypothetical protein BN7_2457 [Wickerhamomyces ciferrii]|uniref:Uncharacterized protein n=1 Tax=Wickerhamomyces ciferrii (strain ATCC 14091 / BCRC 22168 / CBS 111 / JCM 3599 / NBRC 0793 / NRRL Y-1031 F-60-10) TaxID=1206466 RepID=K0KIV1_WICCF|nr:uncharacterized protein BN7_2457 [Wickerhamomyces ciferrii]CCH42911.1 hypothetical protein BN7_2457 [Wickerhamomyces ciferrii]
MSTVIENFTEFEEALESHSLYVGVMFMDEENYPNSKKANEIFEKLALENNDYHHGYYKVYLNNCGDIDLHDFDVSDQDGYTGEKIDNVFYVGFIDHGDIIHYANTENDYKEMENIVKIIK